MATTFTPSGRLALMVPGDPAVKNAWGTILDTNFSLIEAMILGTAPISIGGLSSYTLTVASGAADQARPFIQSYTGALTGNCAVTLPNVPKIGWAQNNTTGGFNVILSAGAGTIATIPPNGYFYWYDCDGAGNVTTPTIIAGASVAYLPTSGGTLTGELTISTGGLIVTAGGITVSAGGLGVTGGTTTDILTVTGAATVQPATTAVQPVQFQQVLSGYGAVYNNVTTSRVLGTTYTNSGTKPIFVSGFITTVSPNTEMSAYVGASLIFDSFQSVGDTTVGFAFVVPVGAQYAVTTTPTATLTAWYELY